MKKHLTLIAILLLSLNSIAQTVYPKPAATPLGTDAGANPSAGGTFIGNDAGFSNAGALQNTFVGYQTGYSNTGEQNTFMGYWSGVANTTGNRNSFYGLNSGRFNTTGYENIFIGLSSGNANTSGIGNSFIGTYAALNKATGSYNTYIGHSAGYVDVSSTSNNTFVGYFAGRANSGANSTCIGSMSGWANNASNNTMIGYLCGGYSSGTTGGRNTFVGGESGGNATDAENNTLIGDRSGFSLTSGDNNTFLGRQSGVINTTGYNNVHIGMLAGQYETTGYNNVAIGYDAGSPGSTTHNNATSIGYSSKADCDGCMVLGNGSSSLPYNVGIGTNTPKGNFHIADMSSAVGSNLTFIEDLPTLGGGTNKRFLMCDDNAGANKGKVYMYSGSVATSSCTTGNTIPLWSSGSLGCSIIQQSTTLSNCVSGMHSGIGIGGIPINNTTSGGTCYDLSLTIYGSALASSGLWIASDRKFKNDITTYEGALDKISKLRGVTYSFNNSKYSEYHFPNGKSIGFIAQELQTIIPEAVMRTDQDFLAVNYEALIPVLTEAIKEQQMQIELKDKDLKLIKEELAFLKQKQSDFENVLSNCCLNIHSKINNSLDNNDISKLEQNVPNPFNEKTVIKFYIPSLTNNASLKVYALDGSELRSFTILSKGLGQVEMNANSLSPGVYVYHLIVDGKQIDGKLMTITK